MVGQVPAIGWFTSFRFVLTSIANAVMHGPEIPMLDMLLRGRTHRFIFKNDTRSKVFALKCKRIINVAFRGSWNSRKLLDLQLETVV